MSDTEEQVAVEDRERKLMDLNAALDQRRAEIVKRAESLLEQQESFLKTCVSDQVRQYENNCDSFFTDGDGFDMADELPNNVDSAVDDVSGSIMSASDRCDNDSGSDREEMPRQQIPQKSQLRSQNMKRHKFQRSNGAASLKKLEMKETDLESDISSLNVNESKQLSAEAALRFQKARYEALHTKCNELIEMNNDKERLLNEANNRCKELENRERKQKKQLQSLELQKNKSEKKNEELSSAVQRLKHEIASLNDKLHTLKKETRESQQSNRANDVRLNRALEDAEKYRRMVQKMKFENRNHTEIQTHELTTIKQENAKLLRQKNELLTAFKKQMKLIDILKKQKIHIEAAKVLQFTEEQFVKTLDIGEQLLQK